MTHHEQVVHEYTVGEIIEFIKNEVPIERGAAKRVVEYFEGTLARLSSQYKKAIARKERDRMRLQVMIEKYKVERW